MNSNGYPRAEELGGPGLGALSGSWREGEGLDWRDESKRHLLASCGNCGEEELQEEAEGTWKGGRRSGLRWWGLVWREPERIKQCRGSGIDRV